VSEFDRGAFTATVTNLATDIVVLASNYNGVAIGTITNGGVYSYSATGYCTNASGYWTDANGTYPITGRPLDCSDFNLINTTNAVCPMWQCFSLVGKIQ